MKSHFMKFWLQLTVCPSSEFEFLLGERSQIKAWIFFLVTKWYHFQGMQPQNRLRSAASSVICSRCTSVLSVNHSRVASRCTSQLSLHHINRKSSKNSEPMVLCKICLVDYSPKETYKIQQCHCVFCKEVFPFLFSFSSTEKLSFSSPNVP